VKLAANEDRLSGSHLEQEADAIAERKATRRLIANLLLLLVISIVLVLLAFSALIMVPLILSQDPNDWR
jgi:hypothetical protein